MGTIIRKLGVLMVLPAVLLVACTSSDESASSTTGTGILTVGKTPPPIPLTPSRCRDDVSNQHTILSDEPSGTTHSLVPGHPMGLVACVSGRRTEIRDAGQVAEISESLSSLDVMPTGLFICPGYLPRLYGLFFNYPNGDVLRVLFPNGSGACAFATNGRRAANMTESVRHVLMGAITRQ